jgi:hypothetical protein
MATRDTECESFNIENDASNFDPSDVFGDVLAKAPEAEEKKTTAEKKKSKFDAKEVKDFVENKKSSPEEIVERQTLLLKLNRYATSNRFSEYLKDMGFDLHAKALSKKSKDELEELMIEIQTTVNAKSSSNIFLQGTLLGANVLENITQNPNIKPKLDLAGFSASIAEDQDLLDAIEAVALEYGSLCMMSPPVKVMYCLLANGARVSATNKMKAQIALRFQQQAEALRPVVVVPVAPVAPVAVDEIVGVNEVVIPISALKVHKPLPKSVFPIVEETVDVEETEEDEYKSNEPQMILNLDL